MSSKIRFTLEQKLQIVNFYLTLPITKKSFKLAASKFACSAYSVQLWVEKFVNFGVEGLKAKSTRQTYSAEFKESVVKSILNRECTYADIVKKYDLNYVILRNWIKKYQLNGSQALKRQTDMQYDLDFMLNAVKYAKEVNNIVYVSEKLSITAPTLTKWIKLYDQEGIKGLSQLYINVMTNKSKKHKKHKKHKKAQKRNAVSKSNATSKANVIKNESLTREIKPVKLETNVTRNNDLEETLIEGLSAKELFEMYLAEKKEKELSLATNKELKKELKVTKKEFEQELKVTKKEFKQELKATQKKLIKTKKLAEEREFQVNTLKKLSALLETI